MIWRFTLHLRGVDVMTEELANRIYEAGCDDSSPSSSNGRVEICFDRESGTLQEAIRSAVTDVGKAGLTIDRVEIDSEEMADWMVPAGT